MAFSVILGYKAKLSFATYHVAHANLSMEEAERSPPVDPDFFELLQQTLRDPVL